MITTEQAQQIMAERAMLDRLLERWQVGQIGPWDVVAEAEAVEQDFLDQREQFVTSDGILMLPTSSRMIRALLERLSLNF